MTTKPEPFLSCLFADGHGLRLTCNCRGRVRIMSPAEACASYGALLRFSEVRAALRARCKADNCKMEVGRTAYPFHCYDARGEATLGEAAANQRLRKAKPAS
jgi:hypothetical protein